MFKELASGAGRLISSVIEACLWLEEFLIVNFCPDRLCQRHWEECDGEKAKIDKRERCAVRVMKRGESTE